MVKFMNQILITTNRHEEYFNDHFQIRNQKEKKKYLFIFFFSIILCIMIGIYLFYSYFSKRNQDKKTALLKDKYNITRLYSSSNQYSSIQLSNDISIIGLIEIPAIHISYPILSNSNENLLKISVCRFAGPLPNRNGNLCIAGHNYRNSLMFSKLQEVNTHDSIFITDLNNVKLEYVIYEKLKVKENNLDCTKETSDAQVTLITCNDHNNTERIVIKAKVKE